MYMLLPYVLASYFLTFFSSCLLVSLFLVIFLWFLSITFPFHELLQEEEEGNGMTRFVCHSQVLLLVSLCNVVHTFLFEVSFIHYVPFFHSFLSHLLLMSLSLSATACYAVSASFSASFSSSKPRKENLNQLFFD